jgi:hypothetical protein
MYARSLTPERFLDYIKALGRKKDLSTLAAIARSDLADRDLAAATYVLKADTDSALLFCISLDLKSNCWEAAFWNLKSHPRAKVIGYIKQVCSSRRREVRYLCYTICAEKRWDDIVDEARRDLNDSGGLGLRNVGLEETLGGAAKQYLDAVTRHAPAN